MSERNIFPALEFKNISKSFGHVQANDNVTMDVRHGEVLSVLGENGCGKTTLMNMAAGIYFPDKGTILVDGQSVTIRSPKDAYKYKIGMIHQHFKLVDIFTAAENIVLGLKEDGKYNLSQVNGRVIEIAKRYGFSIDPKQKIYDMSVSEKQTVEIIKVLYRGADILILDEPTAVLTLQETKKLFEVLRRMAADGKSVVIITHKLNEVMEVSDRVAVMRKGQHVATVNTADTNIQELTDMMVGYKVDLNITRSEPIDPMPRITVRNLNLKNAEGALVLSDVSFEANGGEILGIAGIAGSGQRELLDVIAGILKPESGEIIFTNPKKDKPVTFFHKNVRQIRRLAKKHAFHYPDGKEVSLHGKSWFAVRREVNEGKILFNEDEIMDLRNKTPLEIRDLGVKLSFVPEDRLGMGLVGNMDITDNMLLRSYRKGAPLFLHKRRPRKLARDVVKGLDVKAASLRLPVRRLSGGNLQKILVGREISSSPKVLMAAYPVRGLDINSSYLIYRLLDQQKRTGTAVIYVGEDLDVLMELCDRILVMNSGSVTGLVDGRTVTKEELGYLMTKQISQRS